MRTYLDSSALVKLYTSEAGSPETAEYVRTIGHPLPFSQLHDIEIRNGLRLKVFRKEASPDAVAGSLRWLDEDLQAGILVRPDVNWFDVLRRAEGLSRSWTAKLGCRSLDLLHVASALLLESESLLTFDERQAAVAKRAGLRIIDLKRLH